MSIIIPVRGSANTVEVFNDELPESPTDVIDLLRAELAPLDTWCEFAVAYHCQGRRDQFREVLQSVVDAFDVYEMQDFYRREPNQFTKGQLRILNLLAAAATTSFVKEQLRRDVRDAWRHKALEYIGRADKLATNCPQTWLVKALFWIGEYHRDDSAPQNAGYYADSSLRNNDVSCVASLAKAAILFHAKKYADALWLYVKALRLDPRAAGVSARVGIGFCAHQLGDSAKALAAFERVLSLSPSNVEALVATAVLKLDSSCRGPDAISALRRSETADAAAHTFRRAAELKPTCSIALNHYANHLFWKWRATSETIGTTIADSAREISNLASRSYHCTMVPEVRAEAYFILGRNSHARGDLENALPFYTQACRLWPTFPLAQFRLAQVRAAMGDLTSATEAAETAYRLAPHSPEVLRLLGMLYMHRESSEAACEILQLAVKANKNDPVAWLALANAEEHILINRRGQAERGGIEMAIRAYRTAIQLQVTSGSSISHRTLNNFGVLLAEIGDLKSAVIALHAALDINFRQHASPTIKLGNSLLWHWDQVESETSWLGTHLLHTVWTHIRHSPMIGRHELLTGNDLDESIEEPQSHTRRNKLDSFAAPICTNLAQLYASLGSLTTASELARSALNLNPRSMRALLLLARLDLNFNEYARAQLHIDNAIDLALSRLSKKESRAQASSSHEYAVDALAVASVLQGEVANAVKTLDILHKLCEIVSANAYSRMNLGSLYLSGLLQDHNTRKERDSFRTHQLKSAGKQACSVLKTSPSSSMAAHVLGLSLLELGQLDDAAIIFERLRESILGTKVLSFNIIWDVAINLAHSLSLNERWAEAASIYTACLRIPPVRAASLSWGVSAIQSTRADLSHWLAQAWRGSDNNSGAGWALVSALHLRPTDEKFRCKCSIFLERP